MSLGQQLPRASHRQRAVEPGEADRLGHRSAALFGGQGAREHGVG